MMICPPCGKEYTPPKCQCGDLQRQNLLNLGVQAAGCQTISAAACHSLGLRRDGTVAACGKNEDGRCSVEGWQDIRLPE